MQMRVSESGELILPGALVEQLGMRPGDPIDATFEGGRVVLAPKANRRPGAGIITDPATGWPVLTGGEGAPVLTSEMVAELLVDFP
jgi:bifunctional DNA-binding transcriptional regulator/antitoxin component of YhaV-PrlF toxin-antitoxin module